MCVDWLASVVVLTHVDRFSMHLTVATLFNLFLGRVG